MKLTLCSIVLTLTALTSLAQAAGKNYSCTEIQLQDKDGNSTGVQTLNLYGDDQGSYRVDSAAGGPNLSKDPDVIEINGFNDQCNGAKATINLKTGEGSKEVQYEEHTILFGEHCTSSSKTSFTGCKAN